MSKRLKLIRGDTRNIQVTFKDTDGSVLDITDCTVFFTVNASDNPLTDVDAVISKEVTAHTDAEAGISTIELTSSDTEVTPGSYYYDIQLKDTANAILSSYSSNLTIVADITRRTS